MSLPKITETIGGYDYHWQQELVQIECRRLGFHSDELKGEISISSTSPGLAANHLHRAGFNFSSSQARERLAAMLTKRTDNEFDWPGLLEQACYYTLERFRRGEEAYEIDSSQVDIQPPEYLIRPFLIKNYPSIFFGDPSAGKSLVSQLVISVLSLPWTDNPMNWNAPSRPLKVLYLDWETDKNTVSWTSQCIQRGMETGPLFFHYRRCGQPLYQDVEQISQWIHDTQADVTIIDSLGMAVGGDLNATEPALNFWTAWRQLKTTSLILAHVRKDNGDGAQRTVYGNQYYTAEARCIWEVKKQQEAGDDCLDIALFNRKPPPFAKIHGAIGLHIDFGDVDDNGIAHSVMAKNSNPESTAEFVKAMGSQTQVLDLLRNGALSTEDISETLGITKNNAYVITTRLKSKNKILKTPDGRWGLAYNG